MRKPDGPSGGRNLYAGRPRCHLRKQGSEGDCLGPLMPCQSKWAEKGSTRPTVKRRCNCKHKAPSHLAYTPRLIAPLGSCRPGALTLISPDTS